MNALDGGMHHSETALNLMPKDELIIQLLKIGLGLAFAVYFVWWSLAVLHRLPPPH
jgi:hypothetical protein